MLDVLLIGGILRECTVYLFEGRFDRQRAPRMGIDFKVFAGSVDEGL